MYVRRLVCGSKSALVPSLATGKVGKLSGFDCFCEFLTAVYLAVQHYISNYLQVAYCRVFCCTSALRYVLLDYYSRSHRSVYTTLLFFIPFFIVVLLSLVNRNDTTNGRLL